MDGGLPSREERLWKSVNVYIPSVAGDRILAFLIQVQARKSPLVCIGILLAVNNTVA